MSRPLLSVGSAPGDISSVEDVLALVRASGGRITSCRRILVEELFAMDGHAGAEELAEVVQARMPEVHLSTVYRNLEDLQRLGVVVHSHLGHGAASFQLAAHAHAHFLCESCGATIEAPDDLFRVLAQRAKSTLGFSIDPYHFAVLGRCAACA